MFRFCCSTNIEANLLIGAEYFYPRSPKQISARNSSETSIASLLHSYLSQDKEKPPEIAESHGNVSPRKFLKSPVTVSSATTKSSRKSSDKPLVISWLPKEDYWQELHISWENAASERTVTTSTSSTTSDTYFPIAMTRILSHLYLGSYDDAINEPQLKAKRITHVISLIGKKSPVDFLQVKRIPMHDSGKSNLKKVMEKVSIFMKLAQQDGKGVLIHCLSGQNRSATVVIALLMIIKKKTLSSAYKTVKSLRPVVQINERYAKQLLALERERFGKNTLPCDWMERGEIDIATGEVTYKYENLNSI